MMKIKLKKIILQNFKGIKSQTVEFGEKTVISGRNGSGKSTIFDAFTWLLFGKNAADKKVFNVKTLDEQGNEIPKLEHSVEAFLDVNGSELTLKKVLSEKWVRKRSETEQTFQGNTETFFVDGIGVKPTDYNVKVCSICSENLFKAITSPFFFTAKKWEEQRKDLLAMVQNVKIDYPQELQAIVDALASKNKSIEQAREEIKSVKKSLNAEINSIPAKIEEVQNQMNEYSYDFDKEEAKLHEHEAELERLEKTDTLTIAKSKLDEIKSITDEISDKEFDVSLVVTELKNKKVDEYNAIASNNKQVSSEIEAHEKQVELLKKDTAQCAQFISSSEKQKNELIQSWKDWKSSIFTINDDELKCPTCGREYDFDKMDEIKQEAQAKFNHRKASKLKEIESEGEAINKKIENLQVQVKQNDQLIEDHLACVAKLRDQLVKQEPFNSKIKDDGRIKSLQEQIDFLKSKLDTIKKEYHPEVSVMDEEAKEREKEIIKSLTQILSYRSLVENFKKRISQLKAELRNKSQMLADVESKEYQLAELQKFRINYLESAINGKFDLVKFKLFKQQVNGEVVECCEAMVDGVPYADLNTASKINAGIDIIKTLCAEYQMYAPIFIDNAESVNEILPTASQQVLLEVSNESLTIKNK